MAKTDRMADSGVSPGEVEQNLALFASKLLEMGYAVIRVDDVLNEYEDTGAYSWWDGGSFHANLRASTGLKPQPRRYVEVTDAPERVRRVYRRMKPHYDHLYQHQIRPT